MFVDKENKPPKYSLNFTPSGQLIGSDLSAKVVKKRDQKVKSKVLKCLEKVTNPTNQPETTPANSGVKELAQ